MADLRSLVLLRNNPEAAARFLAQAEQGDVDAVLAQLLAVTGYPSLLRLAMRTWQPLNLISAGAVMIIERQCPYTVRHGYEPGVRPLSGGYFFNTQP